MSSTDQNRSAASAKPVPGPDIFAMLRQAALVAIAAEQQPGGLLAAHPGNLAQAAITVEPPRDAGHGEAVCNAAMVLGASLNIAPRPLAEALASRLAGDPRIASARMAGPGFINLTLEPGEWRGLLPAILAAGQGYGRADLGQGARVCVEFVGAYPVAPLQLAHLRGAVVGDAIARLLERTGHEVTREYYLNDAGMQADVLARATYRAYLAAHGRDPGGEGAQVTEDVAALGAALKSRDGGDWLDRPEADWLPLVRAFALEAMQTHIREDLACLGIEMDVFTSESDLAARGKIEAALALLETKGLIYRGPLDSDEEGRGQGERLLFRATAHGDTQDRPVKGADGKWTYFAPDIAYHHDKIERGFDCLVDVFGTDHGAYVSRLRAVVAALSDGRVPLQVKLCQIPRPMRGGAAIRPSERGLTLRELVQEAGPGVTRFHMLSRKNDGALEFDLTAARAQVNDNPAFAVQYAQARARALMDHADQAGLALDRPDTARLSGEDLALLRLLADYPRQIARAAELKEPHRIAFYLVELARAFHARWDAARRQPALGFVVTGDTGATVAKIALARAVYIVILSGLDMLGVDPVGEMR